MIRIGRKLLSPKKFFLIIIDILIAVFAMWTSVFLHNVDTFETMLQRLLLYSLTFAGSSLIIFFAFGFYEQMWRFASIRQYMLLLGGSLTLSAILYSYMRLRSEAFAWQIYVIYFMITFISTAGVRVAYRLMVGSDRLRNAISDFLIRLKSNRAGQGGSSLEDALAQSPGSGSELHTIPERRRVLVIGAGMAGSQMIRDMQQHNNRYEPVALIDDNPLTHTYKVLGVPVFGGRDSIPEAVRLFRVDTILLAIPSASRKTIREFIDICSTTGCEMKTVPSIQDLISNRVRTTDIKEVDVEDLIGHEPIHLDNMAIAGYINDQVVLVTGGGGLVGMELCRQIVRFGPKQLVIFDIYENNVYQLLYELRGKGLETDIAVTIGSVADADRLTEVFSQYRPNVVFHAAAHKQANLLQAVPEQAMKTNIIGTWNVCRAAIMGGVRKFIMVSADAVEEPLDIFAKSLNLAEQIIERMGSDHPDIGFASVRFGDIINSRVGSVSLIRQQVRNKRRVLIPYPDIARSFLTVEHAAQLVLQTGALMGQFSENGIIFRLETGEPVRLADLARDLIRLNSLEPDLDLKIEMDSDKAINHGDGLTGCNITEKDFGDTPGYLMSFQPTSHENIMRRQPSDHTAIVTEILTMMSQSYLNDDQNLRMLFDWFSQSKTGGSCI